MTGKKNFGTRDGGLETRRACFQFWRHLPLSLLFRLTNELFFPLGVCILNGQIFLGNVMPKTSAAI